jgi:hypothetical protein
LDRERALKVVLVLVGLLFSALVYPLISFVRQEPALAMMLSVYVTLGIFLLLASRNPSANRSLIAFTAWSSFAHAAVMGVQAFRNMIARGELVGVAALVVIGVVIGLAPPKQSKIEHLRWRRRLRMLDQVTSWIVGNSETDVLPAARVTSPLPVAVGYCRTLRRRWRASKNRI